MNFSVVWSWLQAKCWFKYLSAAQLNLGETSLIGLFLYLWFFFFFHFLKILICLEQSKTCFMSHNTSEIKSHIDLISFCSTHWVYSVHSAVYCPSWTEQRPPRKALLGQFDPLPDNPGSNASRITELHESPRPRSQSPHRRASVKSQVPEKHYI